MNGYAMKGSWLHPGMNKTTVALEHFQKKTSSYKTASYSLTAIQFCNAYEFHKMAANMSLWVIHHIKQMAVDGLTSSSVSFDSQPLFLFAVCLCLTVTAMTFENAHLETFHSFPVFLTAAPTIWLLWNSPSKSLSSVKHPVNWNTTQNLGSCVYTCDLVTWKSTSFCM